MSTRRDHALLVAVAVPADAEPGVVFPIDARLDYLVCTNEICVPETATVTRAGDHRRARRAQRRLRRAIARPCPGRSPSAARFAVEGGRAAPRHPAAGRRRRCPIPMSIVANTDTMRHRRAADALAERRPADRRGGRRPPRAAAAGASRACSSSRPATASPSPPGPDRCRRRDRRSRCAARRRRGART